jgi:hypothetical protein
MNLQNTKNQQTAFLLILFAIFVITTGPFFFGEGMFMDGLLYSVISNNLAHHNGSFWNLYLTETLYPEFREHPPLAMAMQSTYYTFFGDSIYIDKLYSISTILITGFLIVSIWSATVEEQYRTYLWLPLFFWIIIPLVSWSAVNNILENTMMIFTTLSVYLLLKSFEKHRILLIFLSGLSLFGGFMSKGFVALFPLSTIFWMWLFTRKIKFLRVIGDTVLLSIATLLPFILIYFFFPQGVEYLKTYFNKQVIGSIETIQTVNSRFFILWALFQQILPVLVVISILLMISKRKKIKIESYNKISNIKYVIAATALSGIVPMMISLKQRGFYITTTLPLVAVASALFIIPLVHQMLNKNVTSSKLNRYLYLSGIFVFIIGIFLSLSFINKPIRDKAMLNDVRKITSVIPEKTCISGERNLYTRWSLHGYLKRYGNIDLNKGYNKTHQFFLTGKNSIVEIPKDFKEVSLKLELYKLYQKK